MKKYILLLLVFGLVSLSSKGQKNSSSTDVERYDFSLLWRSDTPLGYYDDELTLTRPKPIGYIGDNFQRFYIHFQSVTKDMITPSRYHVKGKTRVKNNICDFEGTISINELKWLDTAEELDGLDVTQGVVSGTYTFNENPNQRGTGVFEGTFASDFYIDSEGELHYDALWLDADGYSNNMFEGIWQSYKTKATKKCNWGDYRIPNSRELDQGAGEFSPDDKYLSNGWENYRKAWNNSLEGEKARKEEERKWWE